jgi:predicted ATPase/DNA-binding winged helix-turn-helix (wHTH) protein
MATASDQTKDRLSFGPFNLIAHERLLTKAGAPVDLGGRALDILIVLMSTPNELVSKKDLMSRVWPDVTVDEGSLRFHMAGLRKALGDGKDGARYITTLAGRGYCFVAPVSRAGSARDAAPAADAPIVPAAHFPHANLPNRLSRMVGRDDDVLKLSAQLIASRFVTIVGAGGVGKTTVAVAVGHHLTEAFHGAVLFVDLGMLSDPKLVTTAAASMLGLSVQSDDAQPSLMAHLHDKRLLLILDTCEHLVEAVAALAENIMEFAPQVHILATSREALRVEREHVYRLDALACPPDAPGLTAAAVQEFPATQLFLERAAASGARLELSDAEAPILADICRKLDGVALAIELAARRVESHGLQQTAALLDQRLTLLWHGSRTAPPRQKTLQATLDWSFELLSGAERAVLRRLAVFVGHFTLDAALEVVTSATLDRSAVFGAIDSLVAKSMLATRPIGAMVRYRLLDTTRAYALEIRIDDAEAADLAVRHATYYRRWLEQTGTEWSTLSTGTERSPHFAALNNVRAALKWCFGENGNVEVGIGLAAAAAPVFLAMSLLPECHAWSERGLAALDDATRSSPEEMHLQAALGVSLMLTRGNSHAAKAALVRSLAIAEDVGDAPNQLQMLSLLYMFHHRIAAFKTNVDYAKRSFAVSERVDDPVAVALAHCFLGVSLYHSGDIEGARIELEAALRPGPGHRQTSTIYVDYEHYNFAGIALARVLWLQGHPVQALHRAHQSIEDADATGHPVPLSRALIWSIAVFLAAGDFDSAEHYIERFIDHSQSHSLGPYLAVGRGYQGALAVRRGEAKAGVADLRACLKAIHAVGYELLATGFNIALVQGLAALGQFAEGMTLVDETIRRIETNGDNLFMPELLRLKGALLLSLPQCRIEEAEKCFTQSLELSRRQGARAWELRTAADLAALWAEQGKRKKARELLQPVFDQFVEGLDTPDLQAAQRLLATLG